jgi:hypothetical protein
MRFLDAIEAAKAVRTSASAARHRRELDRALRLRSDPGIKKRDSGRLEIGNIAANNDQAVYHRRRRDQGIAFCTPIGKVRPCEEFKRYCCAVRIHEQTVTWRHAMAVRKLADHHRDPFDRMLVAQAISEPLRLITSDVRLGAYSDLAMLV